MKAEIHPKTHPVVFLDTTSGAEFLSTSTLTSDEKKKINGVEHFVIKVETSSASHPYYTGERLLLDQAGRVDKFMAKLKKAQKFNEDQMKKAKKDDGDDEEEVTEKAEVKKEEKVEAKKEEKKEVAEAQEEKAVEETPAEAPKEEEKTEEAPAEEASTEDESKES